MMVISDALNGGRVERLDLDNPETRFGTIVETVWETSGGVPRAWLLVLRDDGALDQVSMNAVRVLPPDEEQA